ncbi:PilZ domain-containing protein [Planomonospora sp. ID91781]|uniref:methyl-accepting chemotaxis protein n=1 Tax=Planomonospora sp. ID91781 TaxID=2738135 RepID=UPI0018C38537|nr:methyl-accepting chemotaxis protein [Planomonospora sp. ID91781]MBG0823663.1 PilZ domain-containing protein [Planomonospora sp. ID91781]
MKSGRLHPGTPLAGLVVLLVVALGFLAQRQITVSAFDRIEADEVAQDARRIRIALDYEIRLLADYGATNSIWDGSFTDVRTADRAAFEEDFPPRDIQRIYGVDGVVGTGPDGRPRVGGLAGPQTGFVPLPAELARPELLRQLFDIDGGAGAARCGVVRTTGSPLLYCGFASHRGDGGGAPAGGLIYFKTLGATRLAMLGEQIGLPVELADHATPANGRSLVLSGRLGELKVTTGTVDEDHIGLSVTVPTTAGPPVLIGAVRERPIHATATATLRTVFLLTAAAAVLLFGAVLVLVRRGVRRRVGPLLRTAEAVITSGDRSLRVRSDDRGEIGALGRAIDTMLETIAGQDAELERAATAREEQLRAAYVERRLNEQQARRRAQEMINSSIATIMDELQVVVDKTGEVRGTAGTIDEQVGVTDTVAHRVVEQAHRANGAIEQLEESLHKVDGIAHIISNVAAQTHLLALNATIEAVHAGEAGQGFAVVAGEVKDLAAATTRSTEEITAIIRSLEDNATAVTGALAAMSGGIGSLDEATSQVGMMTRRQHTSVDLLNEYLERAIGRISAMARLSEQLERRDSPRAAISAKAWIRAAGHRHPAQLLDLSAAGAHLSGSRGIPLTTGDHVEIDIPLEGGAPMKLKAEIVHHMTREDTAELGLRFTEVPPAAAGRIRHYVMGTLAGRD